MPEDPQEKDQEMQDAEQHLHDEMRWNGFRDIYALRRALQSTVEVKRLFDQQPVDLQSMRTLTQQCVEAALKCNNLKKLFEYCDVANLPGPVVEKIKQGYRIRDFTDNDDYGVYELVLESRDEAAISAISPEFFSTYKSRIGVSARPYYEEKFNDIRVEFRKYAERNKLDGGMFQPFAPILNAANEIVKMDYDLVVAVLNSGRYITEIVEALGQPTRYLEWHRGWRRGPMWRKIGKDSSPVDSAKKILVCDKDSVSGSTLEAIIPALKKLKPEQVDVCFIHNIPGQNDDVMGKLSHFYRHFFQVNEFDTTHFHENVLNTQRKLREENRKTDV